MASKRGFACISPERRSEIARKGGKAAHKAGTAHRFSPEEAQAAGRKGAAVRLARKAEREAAEPAADKLAS